MTVLVIALGVWFIRGPRAKAAPEEDIPPFTPPVSGGAEPSEPEQPAGAEEQEASHGEP